MSATAIHTNEQTTTNKENTTPYSKHVPTGYKYCYVLRLLYMGY